MEGVNTAGVVSVAVGALTAVTATAATYYLASQQEPNSVPAVDLNNQSDILEVCLAFTYQYSVKFRPKIVRPKNGNH